MIRQIAAIDNKRGLAKNGQIPWKLPKDVARFRQLTLTKGANVLVGRATYESMGDYLPNHNIYVVSHSDLKLKAGCVLVKDPVKFLSEFKDDIWVIGGAGIFAATINVADELYLTLVDGDFNCDQFFPEYNNFKLQDTDGPYSENGLNFSFKLYAK